MLRRPVYSLGGVVASEHPLASKAGVEVLDEGGNAVDAAVAVSLVLAVVQPHLGGLGGDYFAIVKVNGDAVFIDGSGPAPAGLTREVVLGRGYREMPTHGPLPITVPGMVDALWLMWSKYGSMEWQRLVEKAATIAGRGFAAHIDLARAVDRAWDILLRYKGGARAFANLYRSGPGAKAAFPGLSWALRRIMEDPRDFYEGDVAADIVDTVKANGGVMELEDLASYHAGTGKPLELEYHGCRILETPPPTQGATTLHILMLLGEDLPAHGSREWSLSLYNASLKAYRVRDSLITDPRHMTISPEDLLNPGILEEPRGGPVEGGVGDTTYYAVADREGNIVSGIQSLYHHFGSGIITGRGEFPLNNRGSDFSLREDHVNRLEPGKRTLHTLSTVLMECGDATYALGTSGGHYRPHQHAQLITGILIDGLDPQEAIERPRILFNFRDKLIIVEEGVTSPGIEGYRVESRKYPSRTGVAAAVADYKGYRAGYVDVRGDGAALGQP